MFGLFDTNRHHSILGRRAKTKEEQRAEMIRNKLGWSSPKCKICGKEATGGTSSNPAYAEEHWCDDHFPER